ncbi:AraC family transcriptional regulator [Proteus sp. GOKU]|uniref:AraC family transcriptional regulator n=1 Tax=Proteus TaxID=583 RepID=UPI001892BEA3|nr:MULTISPECIES: AraC family transcriptional regulator [Proteus]QPB80056.1 AraC family transcriptional regulator [Proteus sp. GOKU]QQP26063.1 AraC family transcriptional regulator [Proteus vulgaris]
MDTANLSTPIVLEFEHFKKTLLLYTRDKEGGWDTVVSGLALCRYSSITEPEGWMYEPSLAIAAQGAKQITIGVETNCYRPMNMLLTSSEIPTFAKVCEASKETPFLAILLKLDLSLLPELLTENKFELLQENKEIRAQQVVQATAPILQAVTRLIKLIDTPEDAPFIAPLIQKEILYYLLRSNDGARQQLLASQHPQCRQINHALDWIKQHYRETIRIEDLTMLVGMSTSSFHFHFKNRTGMTPLQYQKWLRLNEARRIMLIEMSDVSEAAFIVGYESPSQFSREYQRLFGLSPLKDIQRLKASGSESVYLDY